MKNEMPESVSLAIRNLIQVAVQEKVVLAGFAFRSEPPAVTSFGNCNDHNSIKLYEVLCRMVEDKEKQGQVILDIVEKPV